jgi:ankyrin repeat protein
VSGDLTMLEAALRRNPTLIRARSTRICNLAPPVRGATLLHYVAANGVEGYRQKTPPNAVAIARALLTAGADPDAEADLYGGGATTMGLLVSSDPPARAGLSAPLVELLLDFGAEIEGRGVQEWGGALFTALAFGKIDAAKALARRGACIRLAGAAGLGLQEKFIRLLPDADAASRHRALALAAQHGHDAIVGALLDAGEDPNRFNPAGTHGRSTALHQAAWGGHEAVVQLLVERCARLDIRERSGWERLSAGRNMDAKRISFNFCARVARLSNFS